MILRGLSSLFHTSPCKDEHGNQYRHQLQLVRRQQSGHNDEIEDVEEKLLQGRGDKQLLSRPSTGKRRLQIEGGGAELARCAHEHCCEG